MQITDRVLQGRYRFRRILGRGGMGAVYLAVDLELDRMVAVKEMLTQELSPTYRASVVRQFGLEAQILRDVHHPGLPGVHDFFESDGKHYLVMDYIEGRTLDEVLLVEGEVSEERVLGWAEQLCQILDHLHHHKPPVIFRDLKPSNVMVTADERIKLIDFGIAKLWDPTIGLGTQSCTRGVLSPGFAAPEQYAGGTEATSDIYSLGATLYFVLTRLLPPESLDILTGKTRLTPIADLRPGVSASTVRAVEWMMQTRPARRPKSARAVATALSGTSLTPELLQDTTPPTEPEVPTRWSPLCEARVEEPVSPPAQPRIPQAAPLAAGLLLLLVVALAVMLGSPKIARVEVRSVPSGATVSVDGQERGYTPLTLASLPPGTYELRLTHPGYAAAAERLTVEAGHRQTLSVTLSPHHGEQVAFLEGERPSLTPAPRTPSPTATPRVPRLAPPSLTSGRPQSPPDTGGPAEGPPAVPSSPGRLPTPDYPVGRPRPTPKPPVAASGAPQASASPEPTPVERPSRPASRKIVAQDYGIEFTVPDGWTADAPQRKSGQWSVVLRAAGEPRRKAVLSVKEVRGRPSLEAEVERSKKAGWNVELQHPPTAQGAYQAVAMGRLHRVQRGVESIGYRLCCLSARRRDWVMVTVLDYECVPADQDLAQREGLDVMRRTTGLSLGPPGPPMN